MKLTQILLTGLLSGILFIGTLRASHVPGGNITYNCVGPNQYEITLTLFEDCGTAFEGNGSQFITIANDCGLASPTSITIPNVIYQQEVSQLCPAQIGQSECNGGTLPGVWMHQWTGIVTLPQGCDSWTFSYSSCCRNTSINSPNQDSYYWESNLNSATSPCNSSAQITSQPIPYVCANQLVNFNMAAIDPDGNTLQFSLIPAMTSPTTTITYNGGYSGTVPIPGVTINSATGQISFTPTTLGNFIFAVLIEEFDANGNLVGTVIQDFQFEVITCTNQVPATPVGGITNFSGSGVLTGSNSIQACEGDSFCFDLTFSDTDASNVLTVTSNIAQIFPGATVSITGTNPVTAHVCHTIASGAPPSSIISFDVADDACPIPGINSFPITVSVITSTYAGADEIICLNQGVQLTASGGSSFNWTVFSGAPIQIGTNFSCNNCPSPVANPAVTTTYIVTSNLSGGCDAIDTITVNVVPDFTYNITQSSPNSCLQDPISVNVAPVPGGAYQYAWSPSTFLSSTTSSNFTVTATQPGTFTYFVDITSPQGCVKTDSITLVVAPAYAPNVTAMVTLDSIMCGDATDLTVDLGGGVPATCGPSTSGGCSGPVTDITVGVPVGSSDGYSWPSPYGNWYANAKHQLLFTAAELTAMGFVGGKINAITWETIAQNGAQTTFLNYRISMGCTNISVLDPAAFETGLTQVYGPTNYTVVLGQNTHNLTTVYEWDGISNLIVEMCYEWTAQYSYTYNWSTPWAQTTGIMATTFYSDGTAACNYATPNYPWVGQAAPYYRPVTKFSTCPSIPDPGNYSYSWAPSASLDSANVQSPTATPNFSTNYTVTVTDIAGGCSDQSSVFVFVECATCYPPDPIVTDVSCNGGTDGAIVANMVGSTGPWTVNWYNQGGGLLQSTPNVTVSDQLNNLPAGSYTIEIIDTAGCTKDTLITITEPTAISVAAGIDQLICIGGTGNLAATATGGTAPYTYTWSTGATTATISVTPAVNTCYNVSATDANGCPVAVDSVCVFLNPPLLLTVGANDTICPGESYPLTANVVGGNGGPYTYTWDLNGTVIGTGANLSVTPTTGGSQYCVTATDNCGTPAVTQCITLYFYPVPQPSFTGDILQGCYPVTTVFTNTTPGAVSTATWMFGDGGTGVGAGTVSHTYTSPNCYDVTLTVTSGNGCTADTTLSSYVCAWPFPAANYIFGPQPTNLFNPGINFVNASSSDAITFDYDFAGLGNANTANSYFEFPNQNPGTYPVTLVVSNQYGCYDTIVQDVIINGIYTLYAPNAFTPNGDGMNDVFYLQGEGYDPNNFEYFIFDRWGEVMFNGKSLSAGWDGTHKGQAVKGDVYVWKIKSVDVWTGDVYETFGHVTVIR